MFSRVIEAIPKHRLLSIDVFRGITITMMILVNNPGSWSYMYPPLRHAEWNGWTPTDWIFPFFIFIMGISIVLSFEKQLKKGVSRSELVKKSVIRALKLFGLGLVLNATSINLLQPGYHFINDTLYQLRIMGVLQRLAVVYLITALLYLYLGKRQLVFTSVIVLIIYWAAMLFLPFSAVIDGKVTILMGNLDHGAHFAAWLDYHILGKAHVYFTKVSMPYDPEGLWSTLPAVASCLFGVFTGWFIQSQKRDYEQVASLFYYGLVVLLTGYVLSIWIPINKTIWTPSYVFVTAGVALLFLSFCIYLIDMKGQKTWTAPFVVFGANSIAFFMMAGMLGRIMLMPMVEGMRLKSWIYAALFSPLFGNINGSLIFSIVLITIYFIPMYWMYRKGIFWKV